MLVFDGRLERIGGAGFGGSEVAERGEEVLAELDADASGAFGGAKYRTVRALECDGDDDVGDDGVGGGGGSGSGRGPGNGLSAVPCGRCPVFNLCEVGGPVNAEECVYFDEWLGDVGDGEGEGNDEAEDEDGHGDEDEDENVNRDVGGNEML